MKNCTETCQENNIECPCNDCRYWVDYPDDLNCCFVSIEKRGEMDLRTVGDIMGVSFVRIKQIQDKALVKVNNALKILQ